jgi:hypothetical protein
MWRQTKVTVGDLTADQAMVDFEGKEPVVLEWPTSLPFNAEIKIGDRTYFAGYAQASAGKFHMLLMIAPLLPKPTEEDPAPPVKPQPNKSKKP